ncbi:substrate-binding periplasmic protein [Vibrio marisflavi]|uniref:Solute-binding protein family 3/N-terminal domain-containing protein n=1 Tax=Vibrio marisflavi CECT 7928 TaxID=634439 RepID=A0ABM9A4G0_9VIBR|nr:transporter substrate-binding domain-containing protein [Vibrio marisflavi]CAH0539520.1 hypothetical protein VMF7928_02216 [Vibrio marisflavi CECT 7928]
MKCNLLRTVRFSLVIALLSTTTAYAATSSSEKVNVCDDIAEWPPYTYWERVDGQVNKQKLTGAMVDVLTAITKITDIEFDVSLYPWKRCLLEVDKFGSNHKFEMFMDGTFNKERAEKYYLTAPIYFNRAGVWYSTDRFPEGLSLQTFDDIKKYNLCGILGYNYDRYQILDPSNIDTRAVNLDQAMKKVSAGRCDLLLESAAIPYGFQAIGKSLIPDNVKYTPIADSPAAGFHIFIAKTSPRAYELVTKINQAVIILGANGTIEKIMRSYLPTCGRNC